MTETLAHGYSSKSILSESYPMNTNMTWFIDIFQKSLRSCALEDSSLSIEVIREYRLLPIPGFYVVAIMT